MPRAERPLDTVDTTLGRFADGLRKLREKAGSPTYRELASRVDYSVAALSKAAAGRTLPSLAVTVAYVRACDGDVDLWRERWREVAAELALESESESEPDTGPAPYAGLAAFQAADADRFFGRDAVVGELVGLVRERRFTGVFGASGAGKSSVLRAGLLARTPGVVITPGPEPMVELTRAAGADLLVVDQFEEVFTLCGDDERRRFIDALVELPRVVIGVRADFYGRCGDHPRLIDALRGGQLLIGPMSAEDLRQAITRPAAGSGCMVEAALVSRLIADATGQPMALPLVSHALLETWRRRSGATLTVAGYEAVGGIEHAIARTAERVHAALSPPEQDIARHLFLRMTAVGETADHLKRRVRRQELDTDDGTLAILERLTRARLLTVDEDTVDITHEALIRCWPRLREWVAEDRDGLRIHRLLTDATDAWEAHDRDPGTLYRGVRLAVSRDWAADNDAALTTRERGFLTTSLDAETTERATAVRQARRLRRLVALLAVLLVLATAATVFAVRSERAAERERTVAIARRVLTDATALRSANPGLAAQLALAAHRMAPLAETRDALLSAYGTAHSTRLTGHASNEIFLAYAPDGRVVATVGEDQTLRLWATSDPAGPREIMALQLGERLMAVGFAPGGATMVTIGERGTRIWDVTDPRSPAELARMGAPASTIASVAFHGNVMATATNDKSVQLWDIRDPRRPQELGAFSGDADRLHQLAFSPDGRTMAAAGGDTVGLWDVTDPRTPRPIRVLTGHAALVSGVTFSPDGRFIATASWDHDVRLWPVPDGAPAVLSGHAAAVTSVAFSPDGRWLASTGGGTILWDVTDPARPGNVTTIPGGRSAVAFSPDSATVAAVDDDKAVRLQDLRALPLVGHRDIVADAAFAPDGRVLATASWDGTARLWDVSDPRVRRPLATLTVGARPSRSVAFSPDGRTLATASEDGIAVLWKVDDPRRPHRLSEIAPGPGEVVAVAFSPDGRVLAVGGHQGVSLWDATGPRLVARLGDRPELVWSLVFSPDGRTIVASGAGQRKTQMWDVGDPRSPRELELPPGDYVVTARSFSPYGRILATLNAPDKSVRLFDVTDISRPRPVTTLPGHPGMVWMSAFSPDGRLLATADTDGAIRLWDVTRPDRPVHAGTITGHSDDVGAVVFSPDGHLLASTSADRSARVWETDTARIEASICATVRPRISREEWKRYLPEMDYEPPCGP
ncbi:hypothetical protein [Nocardia iowensis]|uniref:HTH cro/C1-type domain-containing protein n=1 Tax=Nocardia iowensis TaxID=204891 RepID=A0ABX8RIT5_NOCIO|nr:hypothetical protein [Nocardia iowensis]QXN88819.1 hypothetical protein KV110_24915 [Nocardia iowensis]